MKEDYVVSVAFAFGSCRKSKVRLVLLLNAKSDRRLYLNVQFFVCLYAEIIARLLSIILPNFFATFS